jgi:hypothetical protein
MSSGFEISFEIDDGEWQALASGGPGLDGEPAFHYLQGDVELRADGSPMWSDPYRLSVLDLALAFADVRAGGFPATRPTAIVRETDGPLALELTLRGDRCEIRSNRQRASAELSAAGVVAGIDAFLRAIADGLAARAPGVLDDEEVRPLAQWTGGRWRPDA